MERANLWKKHFKYWWKVFIVSWNGFSDASTMESSRCITKVSKKHFFSIEKSLGVMYCGHVTSSLWVKMRRYAMQYVWTDKETESGFSTLVIKKLTVTIIPDSKRFIEEMYFHPPQSRSVTNIFKLYFVKNSNWTSDADNFKQMYGKFSLVNIGCGTKFQIMSWCLYENRWFPPSCHHSWPQALNQVCYRGTTSKPRTVVPSRRHPGLKMQPFTELFK